jgi:aspartyl aminopeptidase
LYEDGGLALFKTHYYGGIRKYQWVAMPLALHGVIIKANSDHVNVCIGEDDGDPVFQIGDLLPHLGKKQNERKLPDGIQGEELNAIIGSIPFDDEKCKDPVKLNILKLLNEKYGIVESDFTSAELCLVPAAKAMDVGFDRSMVGSYGHDDRVCAYASIMASLDTPDPEYTWINVLADKEETGSDGMTGMQSRALEYFIADLATPNNVDARRVLMNSKCMSADVTAAFDPTFPDVLDKRNACYLGCGTGIAKFTGSGGKYGTNDATAEFTGFIRTLLDNAKIPWQMGELGKVDGGGGGTVAKYISVLGVDTIDIGVPVLSMHSPFEIVSKFDVYSTYRAIREFLK